MAYSKTNWKNGETPLNADNMNHIEEGVASNDSRISILEKTTPESGKDGLSLLTGHGVPADSAGAEGDSYIDLDSWNYYTKSATAWAVSGNIKGAQGPKGDQGPQGNPGIQGQQGIDGFTWRPTVNATTGTISWAKDSISDEPKQAVIKGPQGDTWKPSVSAEGVLSWTLDKSAEAPTKQAIKGKDGITPNIDSNGYWAFDGVATSTKAKGVDGYTPIIGDNGN